MTGHAKATSAFTPGRSAPGAGRDALALATRGASTGPKGSSAPSRGIALASTLALILALALIAAAGAQALPKTPATPSSFGASGQLAGQFNGARGIAVNETGAGGVAKNTIYVADFNNLRIQSFILDDNGTPEDATDDTYKALRAWGKGVVSAGGGNGAEFQRVTVNASGGEFTLSFDPDGGGAEPAQTTDPIDYDATAAELREALEDLDAIAAGDVRVFGPAGGPWSVRFAGALGNANQALLEFDESNLTGTMSVIETVPGGVPTGFEVCEANLTPADTCKIGETGNGAGHFIAAGVAGGLAVDQNTGNLVVIDRNNFRVQQFTATGEFLRTWGKNVDSTGGTEAEICEVPANCKIGESNGTGSGMFGNFGALITDLATDAAGNVYVLDNGLARIQKFGPTGAFQRMAGWDVITNASASDPTSITTYQICTLAMGADCKGGAAGTGADQFGANAPSFIAASPAGDLYIVARANGMIYRLTSALAFGEAYPETVGTGTTNPNRNALAFDSDDGRVYFAAKDPIAAGPNTNIYELDPATGEVLSAATAAGGTEWVGLAINGETGHMFGTRGTGATSVFVFEAPPLPPVAAIAAATANSGTRATLNGTVNPRRSDVDECFFEWGTSAEELTEVAQCDPLAADLGDGNVPVEVAADITGLIPNGATYHYRLKAVNENGSAQSAAQSFTTPDTVVTSAAAPVAATEATLNGTVDPDGVAITACVFEYGTTTEYGNTAPCDPAAGSLTGTDPVPVKADVNLHPGSVYHFRLKATYAGAIGTIAGRDSSFQTLGPRIAGGFAQDVTLTEATLVALIDPEGVQTEYRFQYGTQGPCSANPCAEVPVPDGAVGNGIWARRVEQRLEGLDPNATYHFRVIATDANLVVNEGPDLSFETAEPPPEPGCDNEEFRVGPSSQLPECRAYEWVTDGESWGGGVFNYTLISPDGEGAQFLAQAYGDSPSTPGWLQPYLARRGEEGWRVGRALPPGDRAAIGAGQTNQRVDDGLTKMLWPNVSQQQEQRAEFDWTIYGFDGLAAPAFELIKPLIRTGDPAAAEVRRFTSQSASPDLSTFTFIVNNTSGAPNTGQTYFPDEPLTAGPRSNLYVIEGAGAPNARFDLVNRATNTPPGVPGAVIGGVCGARQFSGSVSDDGQAIYFAAIPGATAAGQCGSPPTGPLGAGTRLFKRVGGEQTVEVSAPTCSRVAPPCSSTGTASDEFQGASDNGDVVFFTTTRQLTSSDTDATNDLYLYDSDPPAGEPNLVQVSIGEAVAPQHPTPGSGAQVVSVVGEVSGISGDGSRVYFTARGRLVPEAIQATAPAVNLYVYERSEEHPGGRIELVGTLATQVGGSVFTSVSDDGDGRFLVFSTATALLAEDGDNSLDAYRYDDETGELLCVSCVGDGDFNVNIGFQPVSADGSVIAFITAEALDSENDGNGVNDVYIWRDGSLSLASPGSDQFGVIAGLAGGSNARVSADGKSVAFLTLAPLSKADDNNSRDVYVARVGGGFPAPEPRVICASGEECQGQANTAPGANSAATPDLQGTGNVSEAPPRTCGKAKLRRGNRCLTKRQVAQRACAKRKGQAKRRCVANQMRRLNRAQAKQARQAQQASKKRAASHNRGVSK